MPKVNTFNYDTIASWNGSEDLFVVEQPDGTKVATPAMVKQFMEAGDFEATGEVKDGHGNILKNMAKSAEIGDLSQTGLTGNSVAEQLGDASEQIAGINTALATKLSLFESRATTTGDSVTFTKQLELYVNYLVVMSAATTYTGRRARMSLIVFGNNNTINEVYIGDSFTITNNNRILTITSDGMRYGITASILKL